MVAGRRGDRGARRRSGTEDHFVELWTSLGDDVAAVTRAAEAFPARWRWRLVEVDESVADTWRAHVDADVGGRRPRRRPGVAGVRRAAGRARRAHRAGCRRSGWATIRRRSPRCAPCAPPCSRVPRCSTWVAARACSASPPALLGAARVRGDRHLAGGRRRHRGQRGAQRRRRSGAGQHRRPLAEVDEHLRHRRRQHPRPGPDRAWPPTCGRLLAPAGVLVISGVLADRFDHVVDALAPLRVIERRSARRLGGDQPARLSSASISARRRQRRHRAGAGGGQRAGGHGEAQRRVERARRRPGGRTARRRTRRRPRWCRPGPRRTRRRPSRRWPVHERAPCGPTGDDRRRRRRRRAAPAAPPSSAASCSLGTTRSQTREHVGGQCGRAGAGLSTVVAPVGAPAASAAATAGERDLQLHEHHAGPRQVAARTCAGRRGAFAPGTTMIEFSPPAATPISARPGGRVRHRRAPAVSTPAPPSTSSSDAPAASSADRADERDPRAGAGRGDRLVEALAPGVLGVRRCRARSRRAPAVGRRGRRGRGWRCRPRRRRRAARRSPG